MLLDYWPAFNASLNAACATFLLAGVVAIRAKRISAHTLFMILACVVSFLFLISYLVYHAQVGSVHFTGTGTIRFIYFVILISHTVLAVVIVPLILRTLFLAGHKRFAEHGAFARWVLPLWFYVSISGIAVYWMLYQLPA